MTAGPSFCTVESTLAAYLLISRPMATRIVASLVKTRSIISVNPLMITSKYRMRPLLSRCGHIPMEPLLLIIVSLYIVG